MAHEDLLYAQDDLSVYLVWQKPEGERSGETPGLAISRGGVVECKPPADWLIVAQSADQAPALVARNQTLETHVNILQGQLDVVRAAVARQWSIG